MLQYRLALHTPFAVRTIIVEAAYTHAGQPKPLHVRLALSSEERRRHRVRLVTVNFTAEAVLQARCRFPSIAVAGQSAVNASQCKALRIGLDKSLLEGQQRRALNDAIADEIRLLERRHPLLHVNRSESGRNATSSTKKKPLFVHVSDVDELLDPRLVSNQHEKWPSTCFAAHLHLYTYSEHCRLTNPRWLRSVIARADWLVGALAHKPDLELRMAHGSSIDAMVRLGCESPRHARPHVGFHFSYFFSTREILSKLGSFLHAQDGAILATTRASNPDALVEAKVKSCTPMPSRLPSTINASGAGIRQHWQNTSSLARLCRVPELGGWPKHPSWQT